MKIKLKKMFGSFSPTQLPNFQMTQPEIGIPQTLPIFPNQPNQTTFDWNYIKDLNPDLMKISNDLENMNKILNMVVNTDFSTDPQTNQNPNVLQLLKLIQNILRYMAHCQEELTKILDVYKEKAKKYKQGCICLRKKNSKLKEALKLSRIHEKCPSCGRIFRSYEVLNDHMRKRHSQLYNAWISIRKNEVLLLSPQSDPKIQKQINELKRQLIELLNQQKEAPEPKIIKPALFNNDNIHVSSASLPPNENEQQYIPKQKQTAIQRSEEDKHHLSSSDYKKNPNKNDTAAAAAREHAKNFLENKRRVTPILPKTIEEIVAKIAQLVHEQSKKISYAKSAEEEGPDKVRTDMKDDINKDHPMPNVSDKNNLKDLKKKLTKPERLKEYERKSKEKSKQEEKSKKDESSDSLSSVSHCYGDSMPLTNESGMSSVIFSSEFAQYESLNSVKSNQNTMTTVNPFENVKSSESPQTLTEPSIPLPKQTPNQSMNGTIAYNDQEPSYEYYYAEEDEEEDNKKFNQSKTKMTNGSATFAESSYSPPPEKMEGVFHRPPPPKKQPQTNEFSYSESSPSRPPLRKTNQELSSNSLDEELKKYLGED